MKPLIIELPQEMFSPAEYMHIDEAVLLDPISTGPDTIEFPEPLNCSIDITNTGDAFLVGGSVHGIAKTPCARCLEDSIFDIDGEIEGYFLISKEADAPEDLEGDEFEYLIDDKKIDMIPLIESAVLLDLPRVPLCDDDCKGLCPRCGANLNQGSCDCEKDADVSPDNPFAVLKDIKFDQ